MTTIIKTSKKRLWLGLLAVYLILLALSHLVRSHTPAEVPLADRKKLIRLKAVTGETQTPLDVQLAYREFSLAQKDAVPVLILLHGSPMGSESFDDLGPALGQSYRVIVPDLPGFGASSAQIPDYSIRAHAKYILQLMAHLQIGKAHVVAYSMGGGIAINMAAISPESISSLIMLSAIGVQELELLGDYHLNHAVHGAQLGLLWMLQETFPHFGLIDRSMLNTRYARNFYDSDQRPLRDDLLSYRGPMLILHGQNDELVPYAVASEHHRIVPQSELKTYAAGHDLAFMRWQWIAPDIARFVSEVESGNATTREAADPERIAAANLPSDHKQKPMATGIGLIVLMLLIAAATLVSEDLTCIGTGLMVAHGMIGFFPGVLACAIGIYFGDLILFLAGRIFGRPAVAHRPLKWFISENDIERHTDRFNQQGPKIILFSRFLPGSRLPTYFTAGVLRTNFWSFSLYFLLAAAIWTPLLISVSRFIGEEAFSLVAAYKKYAIVIGILAIAAIYASFKLVIPLFSYKGRRLLLSSYRRVTRWEFWPLWVFYIPIVIYILYLGLKHRGLTLFTAVNPAIPESGFIGESKSAILQGLSSANGFVARYLVIKKDLPKDARLQRACAFMAANDLTFPIVIKPDQGQRGAGVTIIHTDTQLEECLAGVDFDVIVQEYVDGYEFGIFYVRYPHASKGFIYSITDKRLISVAGDGKRTLEQLILDDDRAVCLARLHLQKHEKSLHRIPSKGEKIELVDVGTHCRGAMFLNGEAIKTPALEAKIDEISKSFSGFYFGRYDIRAPSLEAIQRGAGFKVVELNGVTSEATHIYDPQNSLLKGYRVLMKQWRLAFEIGARNRHQGIKPATVRQLFNLLMKKNVDRSSR
ncbi:MAG: alpha/beta fold hydrolase [candidate division KSB1 bacterium]|nr:alpha/beta fold hydrolase [candidate division KSB1 bacterium]